MEGIGPMRFSCRVTVAILIVLVFSLAPLPSSFAAVGAELSVSDDGSYFRLKKLTYSDFDIEFIEIDFGEPTVGSAVSTFRFFSNDDDFKLLADPSSDDTFPFAYQARRAFGTYPPGDAGVSLAVGLSRVISVSPFDQQTGGIVDMSQARVTVGFANGEKIDRPLPDIDLGRPPPPPIELPPGTICACFVSATVSPTTYDFFAPIAFSNLATPVPLPPAIWLLVAALSFIGFSSQRNSPRGKGDR